MHILIVAATKKEIGPFASGHAGYDVLITGIGAAPTVYHLQKRLQQIEYDLVIQAGIAGSFNNEIQPGEIVLIRQDCFGDLGLEENGHFKSIFDAGFGNKDEFPFENGWLINPHTDILPASMPAVNAVTVNKVSDSLLQKQQLFQKYSPQVESMEGAALNYVCLQEKLSFLQVRAISNYVGENDRNKWKYKEAITNLNNYLDKMVLELTR
jgi:futalosine hydrolase